ncbi:hypothetical protein [Thermococcus sp. LS1]|nr:hypothetical protein [Thermococcus sp. LS1]
MFERVKPISMLKTEEFEVFPEEEPEVENRPKVKFLFEVKRHHLA